MKNSTAHTPAPNIALPAALIGEPTRAAMLMVLCDGRSHSAGVLAEAIGISPQSASNHLSLLLGGGLLRAVQQGRHRYYRLASEQVAQSIEALAATASPVAHDRLQTSRAGKELLAAQCCYGHLAGSLAVQLLAVMLRDGTLVESGTRSTGQRVLSLTPGGAARLSALGVAIDRKGSVGSEKLARTCVDWTERRDHLAGHLGNALLDLLVTRGHLEAGSHRRALRVTSNGRRFFAAEFGITVT